MRHLLSIGLVGFLILSPLGASSQSITYTAADGIQYLWRVDLEEYPIIDAQIFPKITLDVNSTLATLGQARITWNIQGENGIIAAYGTYNQGQLTEISTLDRVYDTIQWFGLEDNLVGIGVFDNQTDVNIITGSGDVVRRSVVGETVNHKLFAVEDDFFVFANNTTFDQNFYYYLENIRVVGVPTNEIVLAAGIAGAVIEQGNGDIVFYNGLGPNTTLHDISTQLEIGRIGLTPYVFDIGHQEVIFHNDGSRLSFPSEITDFYYFGLASSLIGSDTTIFELDDNYHWKEVGVFGRMPFDFSIVDIGLYLGPIVKSGLGLVMAGIDEDKDGAPDTVEDYFGSLSTTSDTDGDGISDSIEINNGLLPAVDDDSLDYDRDGLNNIDEINQGLDPNNPDSDYGGAFDGWEVQYQYNASDRIDDEFDDDGDGVVNRIESAFGSNPYSRDTDGDQLPDAWEIEFRTNPIRNDANEDLDNDGLTNLEEYRLGTDPLIKNQKEVFEGLYIELFIVLCLSLPLGYLLWRKIINENQ